MQIDEHIHQLALRLGRVLDAYRATKPEFGRPIPRIEDDLERYARRCLDIDLRVGQLADAFEHAGSAPHGGSGGATSSQPVVAAEATIAAALEQAQRAKAAPPRPKKKEHHDHGLLGGLIHAVEHPADTLSDAASSVEHVTSDVWGTVEHAAEHRLHDVEDAGAALVHGIEHPAETLVAGERLAEGAARDLAGGADHVAGDVVGGAEKAGGAVLDAVEHPGDTASALATDAEHVAGAALHGLESMGGGILHAIEHPLDTLSSAEQAAEDFVSGFAMGVRDMAQAAMLLARVIPGTPMWTASMAIDPEGTVKLQEQFAKGLAHMVEHPVDTLGNMIDIRDLESGDYAKWLGHLTPDVIVTVLTAGGGGVAAGAGEGVARRAGEATAEQVAKTVAEGAAKTAGEGAAKTAAEQAAKGATESAARDASAAAAEDAAARTAEGVTAATASADADEAAAAAQSAEGAASPTAEWGAAGHEPPAPMMRRSAEESPGLRPDPSGERGRPPMRDFEDPAFKERTEMIRRYTKEHGGPGGEMSTKNLYQSGEGEYFADRFEQQKQIVLDLLDQAEARGVGHDREAMMLGGMGGAGKSAALQSDAVTALGIDKGRFLTVNPDDIKEIMASRGMIPQYDGLTPMEASTFVHEESSDISLMLAREAVARDMNIAWDMTMHSEKSALMRLAMTPGYRTTAIFVDVPVEQSWVSAYARYLRGANGYREGEGLGGRFVPRDIIEQQADAAGEYLSKNRAAFERVKDRGVFDRWFRFDNSARSVDQTTGEIDWQTIRLREASEGMP